MGCGSSSSDLDSRPRVRYFAGPEFLDIEARLLKRKRNVGLCFSGGGARSAMLTLGYLRALKELKYLKKIRYVSCVSGSAWAVVPWMYKQDITDEEFLGKCKTPETLKLSDLKQEDGAYPSTLAKEISKMTASEEVDGYLCDDIPTPDPGEGNWKDIIGDTFLEPFNCDFNAYFSWTFKLAELISERNIISTTLREFQVPDSPKPYAIMTSLLVKNDHTREKVPFEFTPVMCGCPITDEDSSTISGYVETFGFDQKLSRVLSDKYCYIKTRKEDIPKKKRKEKTQGQKKKKGLVFPYKKFTLRDSLCSSSACLAEMFQSFDKVEDLIFCHRGFKSKLFVYSPELSDQTETFPFIDGGWVDNLGVLCQLKRRVKNVICFVNTKFPVTEKLITIEIEALFLKNSPVQVFKDGGSLRQLKTTFLRLKRQGRPLVCRTTYLVVDNDFYQIDGGWYCNVLWVYNEKCGQFVDRLLDSELQAKVMRDPQFKRFPRYKTALENPPNLLGLGEDQANLLSHIAYFNVSETWDLFERHMDGAPMKEGEIQLSTQKKKIVPPPPVDLYQEQTPQVIQPEIVEGKSIEQVSEMDNKDDSSSSSSSSSSSDNAEEVEGEDKDDDEEESKQIEEEEGEKNKSEEEEDEKEEGKIVEGSSSSSSSESEKEEKEEDETEKNEEVEVESTEEKQEEQEQEQEEDVKVEEVEGEKKVEEEEEEKVEKEESDKVEEEKKVEEEVKKVEEHEEEGEEEEKKVEEEEQQQEEENQTEPEGEEKKEEEEKEGENDEEVKEEGEGEKDVEDEEKENKPNEEEKSDEEKE